MNKAYSIINDKLYKYKVYPLEKDSIFFSNTVNDTYRERDGKRLSVTNYIMTDMSKSNSTKYNNAKNIITENKIKEYDEISYNNCKLMINIAFLDRDDNIIEEGIRVHNVGLTTIPVLCNIGDNMILEYNICSKVYNWLPRLFTRYSGLGIHKEYEKIHTIRINSISLLADILSDKDNPSGIGKISPTIIDKTLTPDSHTIELIKDKRVQLFTDNNVHNILVQDNIDYVEYFVDIKFDMGTFVVNDDSIENLLKANRE
jgi:hypothetical protein